MEHVYLINMVTFHGYISLPEVNGKFRHETSETDSTSNLGGNTLQPMEYILNYDEFLDGFGSWIFIESGLELRCQFSSAKLLLTLDTMILMIPLRASNTH